MFLRFNIEEMVLSFTAENLSSPPPCWGFVVSSTVLNVVIKLLQNVLFIPREIIM